MKNDKARQGKDHNDKKPLIVKEIILKTKPHKPAISATACQNSMAIYGDLMIFFLFLPYFLMRDPVRSS